jgi:hypothetical protein
MEKHQPDQHPQEAKGAHGAAASPVIVMVPLAALTMVQEQLDRLTAAMHHLSIRAVPVYNEPEFGAPWEDKPRGALVGGGQKPQQQPSESQSEAEGVEDFPCTTKWQLYFYGADARAQAVRLMRGGLEASLAGGLFEPQDTLKLFELEDEATPWRCLRLLFETRRGRVFKRTMRDRVLASGTAAVSTNQPKNVSLYCLFSDNCLFTGTAADLVAWCQQHSDSGDEI